MVMTDAKFKLFMFAHCLTQFRYASVGTPVPHDGAFGLPTPGIKAGPGWRGEEPEGYSDLINTHYGQNYTARVRLYQGQRFGYALWAYVPIIVAAAFAPTQSCFSRQKCCTRWSLRKWKITRTPDRPEAQLAHPCRHVQAFAAAPVCNCLVPCSLLAFLAHLLFSTFGLYENKMPRPSATMKRHGQRPRLRKHFHRRVVQGHKGRVEAGLELRVQRSPHSACNGLGFVLLPSRRLQSSTRATRAFLMLLVQKQQK